MPRPRPRGVWRSLHEPSAGGPETAAPIVRLPHALPHAACNVFGHAACPDALARLRDPLLSFPAPPPGRARRRAGKALLLAALLALPAASRASAENLSLHQAIDAGLRSPQARAATDETDEARGSLKQMSLGLNPRLFLQSEDWRPWANDFDFTTQTEDYAYLSQTFEMDGKRHKRVLLGQARLEQAQAREQQIRFAIAGRVAAAYWNAAVQRRIAVLLEQDMAAVDAMVRYHQERVAAGAMRGVDLLRMQIERDRLEMALELSRRDAAAAFLELFRAMGQAPAGEPGLSDPVEQVEPVEGVPIERVLELRPDIAEAQDGVAAAQADLKLQRANRIPNLDLLGGYKRNSNDDTGFGGLQMELPFRSRNQGEVQRADAALRYAQDHLQALETQVRGEVLQSEENYRRQQRIVTDLLPGMRAKAKQNLDRMSEAYRIGGVDLLRFLDAERTEFDVEVSALRAFADYQQAALQLRLSYGVQP
jgi:cobalt-zinc-cadmium efflux system outer membrane protein